MSNEKETKTIKGRVLLDCSYGKSDDIIELSSEAMKIAEKSGEVDPHPSAVAYVESISKKAKASK